MLDETLLTRTTATAILGIDTLWGGDVLDPSGTGRFIADSWFSDEPLPAAYTHPAAARAAQGRAAWPPRRRTSAAVDAYLAAVDVPGGGARPAPRRPAPLGGLRGAYLDGMADSLAGHVGPGPGAARPRAGGRPTSAACSPPPARPPSRRARTRSAAAWPSCSREAGYPVRHAGGAARRGGRLARRAARAEEVHPPARPTPSSPSSRRGRAATWSRTCPASLRGVPRANIQFLPIEDAWFSGSMNYVGRARNADGAPRYEATYEINASLEISVPEFAQLVSHEVVPGHVTTFALAQGLYVQGKLGFEATVLTMNTRGAALSEGIANNAILMAYGVTEVDGAPRRRPAARHAARAPAGRRQEPVLLAHLGRGAAAGRGGGHAAARLPRARAERADKLSGAWGRHPLLGRMYLPAYRAGTEKVAELRRAPPAGEGHPGALQLRRARGPRHHRPGARVSAAGGGAHRRP